MAYRYSAKGNAAIASVKAQSPTANIHLLILDHMTFTTVVLAAKELIAKEQKLHRLITMAGQWRFPFKNPKAAMTFNGRRTISPTPSSLTTYSSRLIHSTSLSTRGRKNGQRLQLRPQILSQERHRFRRHDPRKGLNLVTVRPNRSSGMS
jgi:hypothetical protein